VNDPGQLASAFLAGPQFTADQVDVEADRIAYFWWNPNSGPHGAYEMGTITPQELYEAMSA
jgi:hypothetical protein